MPHENTCPLTQMQLIEEYFMEHRTKILDLAAFLDRMDRSVARDAERDFRWTAFQEALEVLVAGGGERAKRVQMVLSDTNTELLEERDRQGAYGAAARVEGSTA